MALIVSTSRNYPDLVIEIDWKRDRRARRSTRKRGEDIGVLNALNLNLIVLRRLTRHRITVNLRQLASSQAGTTVRRAGVQVVTHNRHCARAIHIALEPEISRIHFDNPNSILLSFVMGDAREDSHRLR